MHNKTDFFPSYARVSSYGSDASSTPADPPDESLASNGTYNERFIISGFLIADQNSFGRFMEDPVIISAGS